ncbi:MAG: tyrosine-type recombinase/integrase [Lachnospiraceae bacterium]|nr:tyrosine-type recombinase/integrase [Lachnospiraceae bacterium]
MKENYLNEIEEILTFGNRSANTIKSYKTYVAPFLDYCVDVLHKDPADVSAHDIRTYITNLQQQRGLADSTVNHAISELRFFFEAVLGITWNPKQVPHRKTDRCLSYVPDRDTIAAFLSSVNDKKKKAMISLLYSSGLRISEVCCLKCADIRHSASCVYVAPGKNRKDRYVVLADEAYEIICDYWRSLPRGMKSRDWLFTQQRDISKPIYPQFIQGYMKKQVAALGWDCKLTCHSLRRAFATHSYQDGMDLLTLSRQLGHSSAATTAIYVHLAELGLRHYDSPMKGMVISHVV